MNINSVKKGASVYKSQEQNKVTRRRDEDKKESSSLKRNEDSLELSAEAKQLGQVQQRIEQGFYDDPAILRQVAEKVNQDLK